MMVTITIQVEFIALNLAAPFLLLGIGVDDTFVMLSAWRRSPTHATVPERQNGDHDDDEDIDDYDDDYDYIFSS